MTLLTAAAAAPETPISSLPLMTDAERMQLDEWNATTTAYDRRCLHEQFADQAARVPGNVAVVDGPVRVTYAELDRRSNQLAHELRARGVEPGQLVGICLDRSAELVIALMAVLKTGAAYVPIEPTYPPQRQEYMLADARAPVLITQERHSGVVDARDFQVVWIDRDVDAERIAAQPTDPVGDTPNDPEQLAYVIYTSGSTGQPKGVEITHRSVANLLEHMRAAPGLTERDVLANLTTPAFDLSVPDWYLPLTTGAQLAIVPREATTDAVALANWLAQVGATFVQATPTTWQLLVDTGWQGSAELKIVCGGEALPRALAQVLLTRGHSLWHMYGPTETTVWSSIHQLSEPDPVIAGPIANTSLHLLDEQGEAVPVGIPGELYIGGDGLARGYRNRSELTAERFVDRHEGRLYRTGDLLRRRESGQFDFLGRIDHQVKLRGFRIELGEIEAVLADQPGVAGAAAVVHERGPGDQWLVAYVVPAEGKSIDVEELRAACKTRLAPYMMPGAFMTLDAFPTTPNRKLDRRALPVPDGVRPDFERTYVPPETPVEESIAEIWSEVLGLDRVGMNDDFFDLGGHSLLAVRMLARVQDHLGVGVTLGTVFEQSTVRELAAAVTSEMLADAEDDELAALLAEAEASEP